MLDIIRASMNLMQNTMTEMRLAGRDARDYVVIEPAVHGRNLLEREKQFDHLMTCSTKDERLANILLHGWMLSKDCSFATKLPPAIGCP